MKSQNRPRIWRLLLVDCVTSLGGMPVKIDETGIDIAYSGTQKCLGVPPGLAPLTINPRAVEALHARKTAVPSWYFDITAVEHYWGPERTYHHTAPISMNYALREGLRMIQEEGLEARFKRHLDNAELFWDGLKDLGLEPVVRARPPPPLLDDDQGSRWGGRRTGVQPPVE